MVGMEVISALKPFVVELPAVIAGGPQVLLNIDRKSGGAAADACWPNLQEL